MAFQKGLRSFNLGKWDEAVAGFEKSYKLSGDPALLFNVAQAQRQAGHRKEALIAYRAFLRENPDTPHRDLVESKIREMEASKERAETVAVAKASVNVPTEVWVDPFQQDKQAQSPGPAEGPAASIPGAEAAKTASATRAEPLPSAAPAAIASAPPAPPLIPQADALPAPVAQTQSAGRWWLWTGIGAAVAAGVVTALILSTRGTERDGSCPAGVDGCLAVGK